MKKGSGSSFLFWLCGGSGVIRCGTKINYFLTFEPVRQLARDVTGALFAEQTPRPSKSGLRYVSHTGIVIWFQTRDGFQRRPLPKPSQVFGEYNRSKNRPYAACAHRLVWFDCWCIVGLGSIGTMLSGAGGRQYPSWSSGSFGPFPTVA